MKYTHIPLLDYIDIEEEQCDIHVHTKDKRILVFKDIQSNGHLDENGLYVDYMFFSRRMSVFVPREDFSHVEYMYSPRNTVSKKYIDSNAPLVDDLI